MKMGAGAPILDRHQVRQNIDFFNTIRTKLPFELRDRITLLSACALHSDFP